MYDFTHCLSDSIEGITHSLCTLEFENNRALYDWVLDNVDAPCHPQQIEFARLNLSYTVLSKRKLIQLVDEGMWTAGTIPACPPLWPAAPGLSPGGHPQFLRPHRGGQAGQRGGRGPAGVQHARRPQQTGAPGHGRAAAAEGRHRKLPRGPGGRTGCGQQSRRPGCHGKRKVPFSRNLHRARRLHGKPAQEVLPPGTGARSAAALRLFRHLPEAVKDPATGESIELRCTYDPATRGGNAPDGRKVKATLHWVSAAHALDAEVRLYDRLFTKGQPGRKGPTAKPIRISSTPIPW
jgi:glutaminyl-tRNA synthetase